MKGMVFMCEMVYIILIMIMYLNVIEFIDYMSCLDLIVNFFVVDVLLDILKSIDFFSVSEVLVFCIGLLKFLIGNVIIVK